MVGSKSDELPYAYIGAAVDRIGSAVRVDDVAAQVVVIVPLIFLEEMPLIEDTHKVYVAFTGAQVGGTRRLILQEVEADSEIDLDVVLVQDVSALFVVSSGLEAVDRLQPFPVKVFAESGPAAPAAVSASLQNPDLPIGIPAAPGSAFANTLQDESWNVERPALHHGNVSKS